MANKVNRTSTEWLKDTFKIAYEAYKDSKDEAEEIREMYHNRQYTDAQLEILEIRGQPAETFNIIKLFSRLLLGYYSTVINTVSALPVGPEDAITSAVLNDTIQHTIRDNHFVGEGEKIKLDGILTGLMTCYINVVDTGRRDQFDRPINRVILERVSETEILRDPMAKRDDYEDARFIHRHKWISEEAVLRLFGEDILDQLVEYYNFTGETNADFEEHYDNVFAGMYKMHNNYLIVHSIVIDEKGDSWSIIWHDELIIEKKKITHKEVKFPYRTLFIHPSEKTEYYGIFRDVKESQKAINQALIKFQLLVNTQKAFVEDTAVENIADFTNAFNRVTAVVPTLRNSGIKIENLTREAMEQYAVIDKAFDRIQRVLGINDSFLGMAFASDSGRKVKLQQNASIIALRYFTGRVETFWRFLGWDIANLQKQYYTAYDILRISDNMSGYRWLEINKPMEIWTGQINQRTGEPIMDYVYEPVLDPASGELMEDEDGNYIIAPIPEKGTDFQFTNVDIEIVSTAYNDEDERNQLMLESILQGYVGQLLAQINPAGYFQIVALSIQAMKTKNAPEITNIINQTSQMLGMSPEAMMSASMMAGGAGPQAQQTPQPMSQQLKLPQNTNEAV